MANFQKIKELAQERNMSLASIAEQVGITKVGMSILIRENKTLTQTIEKIAKVLDVPVGYFFDDDVNFPRPEQQAAPQDTAQLLEIIAQKDKIIEQQGEVIRLLSAPR